MRRLTGGVVSTLALLQLSCAGAEEPSTSVDAPAPLPHERALWPMPNPAALALPHAASYAVSPEGGVVSDRVTGLGWQRVADRGPGEGGGFVAADAEPHCDGLVLEGHADFRLPTRVELVSLVDFSTAGPTLDPAAFSGEPSEAFWTRSPVPSDPEQRFHVNFFFGYTTSNLVVYAQWVRCVRTERRPAAAALAPALVTETTVLDRATGLEWQRIVDPTPVARGQAVERCATLVLNGAEDFRAPSMKELQTLVDERSSGALLLDESLFPATAGELFWSSSLSSSDATRGWLVRFSDGYSLDAALDTPGLVRCVR